ncbi:hypothetical protein B0H14DRAFT_2643032 [Mycena olivaceomarginata]|nr:hypothetical protein B0H14DRAFT_2643032 [Mycena olivaceomarginata]
MYVFLFSRPHRMSLLIFCRLSEEVDRQIKGYPNQQYRRKHDKKEALMAYAQRWQDGGVEKSLGLDPGFAPSIRLFRSVSPPLAKRPMKTGNHTRLMVGPNCDKDLAARTCAGAGILGSFLRCPTSY